MVKSFENAYPKSCQALLCFAMEKSFNSKKDERIRRQDWEAPHAVGVATNQNARVWVPQGCGERDRPRQPEARKMSNLDFISPH